MPDVSYTIPTLSSNKLYRAKSGVRQKPFVAPKELPYRLQEILVTESNNFGVDPGQANSVWGGGSILSSLSDNVMVGDKPTMNELSRMYNRLYDKLLSKVGERASMLTALAEMKSTSAMVASRLNQLLRAAKALSKGRLLEFFRALEIDPKPKHKGTRRSRPKEFASLWLEYWFGWAPTIGDIGNAIDAAQSDFHAERFKVASGTRNLALTSNKVSGAYPRYQHSITGRFIIQCRCTLEVVNHNLWVANQMGFTNPVRTVWELIPFSWFADWFTNVGQVLGAFTDTMGVVISDIWMTRFARVTSDHLYQSNSTKGFHRVRSCVFVNRQKLKTLPKPSLTVQLPKKLSWQRGATLSALLVQLFLPKPKSSFSGA